MQNELNGWLNIDKPLGYSSAKVVAIIKKILNVKKVGHGGTLDPLATGVLPICINKATKTTEKTMSFTKKYLFIGIRRGSQTARRIGRQPPAGLIQAVFEFRLAQALLFRSLHQLFMKIRQDRIVIPGHGLLDILEILRSKENTRMIIRRETLITCLSRRSAAGHGNHRSSRKSKCNEKTMETHGRNVVSQIYYKLRPTPKRKAPTFP